MALTRAQILNQPTVEDPSQISGGSITLRDTTATPVEISFKVANTQTDPYNITFPSTIGTPGFSGYVMTFSESSGEITGSFGPVVATAAGTDGQIQFNNAGVTGATSTIVYDDSNLVFDLQYDGTNNPSFLRFSDDGASNYAQFQAPADITRDYSITLPALVPGTSNNTEAVGYVLKIASHSDQSVVGATTAVLEWGPPLTGSNVSQGPAGNIQTSDNTGGFEDKTAGNYLIYNTNTLNFQNTAGEIQINGGLLLNSTTLGSTVLNSSLTSVGTLTALTVNAGIQVNNSITTPTDTDLLLSPNGTGDVIITAEGAAGKVDFQDAQGTPRTIGVTVPANIGTLGYNITLPAEVTTPGDMVMSFASDYSASYIDNRKTVNLVIDGGNEVIQNEPHGSLRFDGAYTITDWYILSTFPYNVPDSFDVVITKGTLAELTAGTAPSAFSGTLSLSNANAASGVTTGWSSNTIADGDILYFEVQNHAAAPTGTAIQATISLTLVPTALT